MSKLRKFVKAVSLLVKQPSLLNRVLDDNEVNKRQVVSAYQLEHGLPSIRLTDLVPDIDITVSPYAALDGGSTPIDIALLRGLANQTTGCSYFEIGTWRGESVANVAAVAATCYSLNLPDETMINMGMNKNYVGLHRFFSKNLPNVTHLFGNSHQFDFTPYNGKIDLVFVDGDHHYASVKNDTEKAFRLLKDENAVIVWHDYGNNPGDVRWDVLRGILDGTPEDKRKHLYRVSNTLCAIYTNKNTASRVVSDFEDPTHFFNIRITATKTI